jgi:carbonic anhydrase
MKQNIQEIIDKLIQGNLRFSNGNSLHPNIDEIRKKATLEEQKPFAIIVGCSDSRIPPEIIFDQGIGDLFIIRTAGYVIDNIAMGSIEYAILHLDVKLIVVLGHENCGAITASYNKIKSSPNINNVVKLITPNIKHSKNIDDAINLHTMKISRQIREHFSNLDIEILPLLYKLNTNEVSFLTLES